jgi:hypothetical protein
MRCFIFAMFLVLWTSVIHASGCKHVISEYLQARHTYGDASDSSSEVSSVFDTESLQLWSVVFVPDIAPDKSYVADYVVIKKQNSQESRIKYSATIVVEKNSCQIINFDEYVRE